MTNNAGLKSCKNFYNEKFKEWQPTLLHKSMPSLALPTSLNMTVDLEIKVSDLFIPLLPTAFDVAGSSYFFLPFAFFLLPFSILPPPPLLYLNITEMQRKFNRFVIIPS